KKRTVEQKEHIRNLLDKYLSDTHTRQEYEELLRYFDIDSNREEAGQLLYEAIAAYDAETNVSPERFEAVTNNAFYRLQRRIKKSRPSLIRRLLPYAAAILILFFLGIGYYLYTISQYEPALTSIYGDDVLPGTNKAIITLSDGSRYELSEAQGGVRINE